jgi:hypothetical protein
METRGMSEEEANQRLSAMVPLERRAPGADFVYKNNGSLEDLRTAVNAELDRILALRASGTALESNFHAWWEKFLEENKERPKAAGVAAPEGAGKTA